MAKRNRRSLSRIRKTARFDCKVVFGSCKFNLDIDKIGGT